MNHWLILIPGMPLLGAIIIGLIGRRLPARWCAGMASGCVLLSAIGVLLLWGQAGSQIHAQQTLFHWMSIGTWQITLGLKVDNITLIMLTVSTFVGFLIHLFSMDYMKDDASIRRYFFYLNLFIAGMVFFVMADNLILLYMGWEVMGLCSYALISFYYHKQYNAFCGRKAFVVTRIGDTALVLAIIFIFAHFGTLDIATLLQLAPTFADNLWVISTVALLLLVAAMAKSAQFPLHIWLPDAMTGPSPVSALIHAATMVTAGVYLIVRFHGFFDLVPDVRTAVAIMGAFTALYAASCALSQTYLKRILAYSTISQIGYMFVAAGVGAYSLALFHLAVHACFKGLLFMGAGTIGNLYNEEGDVQKMGGLAKRQPLFHICYLIACLTLSALPLVTASFYSKDAIITASFTASHGWMIAGLGLLGSLITGAYSMRLYLLVFGGTAKTPIQPIRLSQRVHIPLVILALCSVTLGFIQVPHGWFVGSHWLEYWLNPLLGAIPSPDEHATSWLEWLGVSTALLGIGAAFLLVRSEYTSYSISRCRVLREAWHIDTLLCYTGTALHNGLVRISALLEHQLLNRALIGGMVQLLVRTHRVLSQSHQGRLGYYLYGITLGAVLILGFVTGVV